MVDRLASERMFAVIVLGGIALTASAATCGGTVIDSTQATGVGGSGGSGGHGGMSTASSMGGFPQEGPAQTVGVGGFPQEGPVTISVSVDVGGGNTGFGGFPQETDQMPDAGQSSSTGFPNEAP